MRYLGAYPTEEELVTDILPQILDDEETQFVKYDRFEPFMVKVLVEKNYEPDSEETILQAFRVSAPWRGLRVCVCVSIFRSEAL